MALQQNGAKDFDDLVSDTLNLVRGNPERGIQQPSSGHILATFRHLLVDEWQDVDSTQVSLFQLFSVLAF
jgi:superfamily I DNA/RNA helicase